MKKLLLFTSTMFLLMGIANAQDCASIYPNTKGSQLVTKSYNAQNNLISTTTYTVEDAFEYTSGSNVDMRFSTTNWQDRIVDEGKVSLSCDNGTFTMKMNQRYLLPEDIISALPASAELVANYLDYPNTVGLSSNTFDMEDTQFTIRSKNDKKDYIKVDVKNRKYEKSENITTPAGTFDASKITFAFDVYTHETKSTKKYKGVEWYAAGAGIVRTETYDDNNNLLGYSVLEMLRTK